MLYIYALLNCYYSNSFVIAHCAREISMREKNEYRILGNTSLDDKDVFDVSKNNGCRILGNSLDDKDVPGIIERKNMRRKAQGKKK